MATIPILNLQVAGRQAAQFGAQASRTFEGHGGSIGRSEDCDWVLSASGVSRLHARITVLGNRYYIEDRSTNGMLLNGAPMVHAQPSLLQDGDRVRIDTFELEVRIGNAEQLAAAVRTCISASRRNRTTRWPMPRSRRRRCHGPSRRQRI